MSDQGHGTSATRRRRRHAKGRRPFFFDDPNTDKLLAIIAALAGEVSVLRQRLVTHERVAKEKNLFSADDIESYEATPDDVEELAAWRSEFLSRVFRILEFETAPDAARSAENDYENMIAGFARDNER